MSNKLHRTLFTASLIALLALTASCSTDRKPPTPNKYSDNLLSSINTQEARQRVKSATLLAESAVSVSQSLAHLTEVERAVYPHAKLPPPPDALSIGMSDKASIDWSGPVQTVVSKIAEATHYRLRILGRTPAIPIIVSVTAKNAPLADILRDISFQANEQATIMLYPKRRVIELRYRYP